YLRDVPYVSGFSFFYRKLWLRLLLQSAKCKEWTHLCTIFVVTAILATTTYLITPWWSVLRVQGYWKQIGGALKKNVPSSVRTEWQKWRNSKTNRRRRLYFQDIPRYTVLFITNVKYAA
ncbi:hypothetical protein L9F63_026127, partial [Diploptera punctata]